MDGNGGNSNRITSIRQIVKFKEFVKKWQLVALSPGSKSCSATPSKSGGISPEVSWRLRNCESDEESHHSVEMPPSDVPKGYLAVYVGPESDVRRFIIPTTYLSDPLFKVLLQKVEEEFGFDHTGGLTIPCDIETFKYLLECMKNHRKEEAHHTNAGQGQTSSSV